MSVKEKWKHVVDRYWALYLSECEKYRYQECHGGC